ncbi:hypothetical protein Holit_01189 [Hollandina sp. SP2]
MKGVIVQAGKPKSIVLFNNGKIAAIPTPADGHVGMVVTVKYNNKLKILILTLAAVLMVGLGVCIGVFLVKDTGDPSPPAAVLEGEGTYGWQRGQEKMREIDRKFAP